MTDEFRNVALTDNRYFSKAVTAELTAKPKPKAKAKPKPKRKGIGASAPARKKPAKKMPKPKPERACVICTCTEAMPCLDGTSLPCRWVGAEELPEGVEGPLCSACLPAAAARAAQTKKRDRKKAKPSGQSAAT